MAYLYDVFVLKNNRIEVFRQLQTEYQRLFVDSNSLAWNSVIKAQDNTQVAANYLDVKLPSAEMKHHSISFSELKSVLATSGSNKAKLLRKAQESSIVDTTPDRNNPTDEWAAVVTVSSVFVVLELFHRKANSFWLFDLYWTDRVHLLPKQGGLSFKLVAFRNSPLRLAAYHPDHPESVLGLSVVPYDGCTQIHQTTDLLVDEIAQILEANASGTDEIKAAFIQRLTRELI